MSLETYDGVGPLTSPRSLEACAALGILWEDDLVQKKWEDWFDEDEGNKELAEELA